MTSFVMNKSSKDYCTFLWQRFGGGALGSTSVSWTWSSRDSILRLNQLFMDESSELSRMGGLSDNQETSFIAVLGNISSCGGEVFT